jgi:hypothetical protein
LDRFYILEPGLPIRKIGLLRRCEPGYEIARAGRPGAGARIFRGVLPLQNENEREQENQQGQTSKNQRAF